MREFLTTAIRRSAKVVVGSTYPSDERGEAIGRKKKKAARSLPLPFLLRNVQQSTEHNHQLAAVKRKLSILSRRDRKKKKRNRRDEQYNVANQAPPKRKRRRVQWYSAQQVDTKEVQACQRQEFEKLAKRSRRSLYSIQGKLDARGR